MNRQNNTAKLCTWLPFQFKAEISISTQPSKRSQTHFKLKQGLEWNDTGGAGPVDKNFALSVSLRVSNHLPYEQNLITRIDIWRR